MAESDWDSVTYLKKRTPRAAEMRSKQVCIFLIYGQLQNILCFSSYEVHELSNKHLFKTILEFN